MTYTKIASKVTAGDLRELAGALGCRTQADLARALGITQARVSQILTGRHPLKPGALQTLIQQLRAQHVGKKRRV